MNKEDRLSEQLVAKLKAQYHNGDLTGTEKKLYLYHIALEDIQKELDIAKRLLTMERLCRKADSQVFTASLEEARSAWSNSDADERYNEALELCNNKEFIDTHSMSEVVEKALKIAAYGNKTT